MRTTPRSAVVALTLLTAAAATLVAAGCGGGGASIALAATTLPSSDVELDGAVEGAVEVETVEVETVGTADAPSPAPQSVAASADLSGIAAAAESRDPCAVYEELQQLSFDGESFAAMATMMERVESLLGDASEGVDRAIRDEWATITGAIGDLATALRSGPDAKDAASAVLSDPRYTHAERVVDEWLAANCD